MMDDNADETTPTVMETISFSQVVFNDVPPSYPPNTAVTCRYTITGGLQPNPRDWIGIFKVGWQSTQGYYNYEWVQPCLDQVGPEALMQVVFKENYIPKDDGEFYQFCYVDSNGHVKGASTPFCFRNPAETSLDSSLEKDLLVVTTQEQVQMMAKEKEDFVKEIESLKEEKTILKNELDHRLRELCRIKKCLEELKSKENLETSLSDVQNYDTTEQSAYLQSLTSYNENYEKAIQKINVLKKQKTELQQQTDVQFAENLKLNTCLNEMEHNYNKLQDRVKLLEVDVQSSKKNNEKLHGEIEELLRVKKALEDQREENRALQASMSGQGGDDYKVQIQALLTQLTESRGLLRSETQNCKEATKRAEIAEQELKEEKKKLAEMAVNKVDSEKYHQIQTQLQEAQDKIYELAEESKSVKQKFLEQNEELNAEIVRLRKAVFDYQMAAVAAMSDQLTNPHSPPASTSTQEQTHPPDSNVYENIIDLSEDPSEVENKMRVCQHCQESFPDFSEDELALHELAHKVCPFCTLICDDMTQQQFEDHVYSHEL